MKKFESVTRVPRTNEKLAKKKKTSAFYDSEPPCVIVLFLGIFLEPLSDPMESLYSVWRESRYVQFIFLDFKSGASDWNKNLNWKGNSLTKKSLGNVRTRLGC